MTEADVVASFAAVVTAVVAAVVAAAAVAAAVATAAAAASFQRHVLSNCQSTERQRREADENEGGACQG